MAVAAAARPIARCVASLVEHQRHVTARTAPDSAAAAVHADFHVRVATPHDAPALAAFATRTFTATYARGGSGTVGNGTVGNGAVATSAPEDVAAYVTAAFTADRMRAELGDPTLVTLIAVPAGNAATAEAPTADTWAGYAQLRLRPSVSSPVPPPCAGPHPRELARLYVERAWHGRGIADRLVDAVISQLRTHPGGADPLWLAVYQANARAVAFYRRRNFAIVGATTFTMGAERQHDWLMVWRG